MRFGMKKIEIKTFFFFLIYNYLIFKNYDNFCTIIILQKKKKIELIIQSLLGF